MALSELVKVGLAQETTWGTPVAATVLLPVNGEPKFTPQFEQILDQARRGVRAKDFAAYQGAGHGELELGGPVYPDEFGYLLKCLMGTVSTGAAVSGVYPHTFSLGNTPPSLTFEDQDPTQARAYAGMTLDSLGLKFNTTEQGGMLEYTSKWQGKTPTTITAASISDATQAPFLGWQAALSLAGSSFTRMISGELTFSQPVELTHTGNATQSPSRADVGELEVTGSVVVDRTSDDLLKYLNKVQEAMVLSFTRGSAGTLRALTCTMSNWDYGEQPSERDLGSAGIKLTWHGRALYNATDGGPCKWLLNTTKASY